MRPKPSILNRDFGDGKGHFKCKLPVACGLDIPQAFFDGTGYVGKVLSPNSCGRRPTGPLLSQPRERAGL